MKRRALQALAILLLAATPAAAATGSVCEILLQANVPDTGRDTEALLESTRDIVQRRIDAEGMAGAVVSLADRERIRIRMSCPSDLAAAAHLVTAPARVQFRAVDVTADPEDLENGFAPPGSELLRNEEGRRLAIRVEPLLDGDDIADAAPGTGPYDEMPVVKIRFTPSGAVRLAQVTANNVNKPIAIVLDGAILSTPTVLEPMLNGEAQIAGRFTIESARMLAIQLRSGRLPVALTVISTGIVDE